MALTIEQLDDDVKENNVTIIIGKELLLKFTPGRSIFFSERVLQDFIKTPDLLCSNILTAVMEEKVLSEKIDKALSHMVGFQNTIIELISDQPGRLRMKDELKKNKDIIIERSAKIKKIESD